MNWITSTLLMLFFSVILYLFIRKIQLLKIHNAVNNFFILFIPIFFLFFLILIQGESFILPIKIYLLIFLNALFFSYFGNKLFFLSLELAPNPGYPLTIAKSYFLFTTFASVFLFHSILTLKDIIAILIIIIFSLLIIDTNSNKKGSSKWILYAIGVFFAWGLQTLLLKYLINIGIKINIILFYIFLFGSIFSFVEIKIRNIKLRIKDNKWILLFLCGIFSALANIFMLVSFRITPNIGFVNAANTSSTALLTPLSALFFQDKLSVKKMIGVTGVLAGLIILFL